MKARSWGLVIGAGVLVVMLLVGGGIWLGINLARDHTPVTKSTSEASPSRTPTPKPQPTRPESRPSTPTTSPQTTAPEPPPPAPPPPAPPEVLCPSGQVSLIYSQMQNTEYSTHIIAWTAGVVRNDSDWPVTVYGQPGAWGVDANGVDVIPVGGYWQGNVHPLYPGEAAQFQAQSAALSAEEVATVTEWRFIGAGAHLSATWHVGSECDSNAPISLTVMN